MAEAEEVLADAARHATVFVRDLWRRHRGEGPIPLALVDVAGRLELLLTTVFGGGPPIRVAEPPAPPTLLTAVFGRRRGPVRREPVPATDGSAIWLPAELGMADTARALDHYRSMALAQAMRARRGGAAAFKALSLPLERDLFVLIEACAADLELARMLPGTAAGLNALRAAALASRPAFSSFPLNARPVETLLRRILEQDCRLPLEAELATVNGAASAAAARRLARELAMERLRASPRSLLYRDRWTGDYRPPDALEAAGAVLAAAPERRDERPKTARISRRPKVRQPKKGEDSQKGKSGAWMVQADEPHQKAEDPMGLQRPTDRDDEDRAEEMGDMLSELKEARLIATPGSPREVLLSDDPPEGRARATAPPDAQAEFHYPEWDYRAEAYRSPGATVRRLPTPPGPQAWVEATLEQHRSLLLTIRRRFEMLRAQRLVLRRQVDGDDVDLGDCVDALADLKAGAQMSDRLYRCSRPMDRSLAVTLLIDVSGSTDGWVSSSRRTIDVEREALLLVCIALAELHEPYAVLAFSGESPGGVTVRTVKGFEEDYGNDIAVRIASLEPERYTRTGAALRHATAMLMQQRANHRLLLLLSDGKPNDVDVYEGRYGVEDTYRAVTEARLQGIYPFCLTIDRRAAAYLPQIFGANQYAMLPRPELLPTVLLDWMRRLLAARQ